MSDLLPSLGCFGLLALVLPIWSLIAASRMRQRVSALDERLEDFSTRLKLIEARLLELRREMRSEAPGVREGAAAEATSARRAPAATLPGAQPGVAQPDVATPTGAPPSVAVARPDAPSSSILPPPVSPAAPPSAAPPAPPAPPRLPAPSFAASTPPPSGRTAFDWENMISVRAFAWLGGGALFLGAALFLQYSIQHGLISPAMRVAIGLIVGSAALVWGDSLRARAMWAGQATSGAGVAVLYASFFAAHSLYGLIGTPLTFAAMGLVTLVAGLLAVRRDAYVLAFLGLIGGFLTPYLLATSEDHPLALLGYVLLLDVGVLTVVRSRRWTSLTYLALLGSTALYAGWCVAHLDAAKLPYALGAAVVVSALFVFRGGLREVDPMDDAASLLPVVAAAIPFVMALVAGESRSLAVSPAALVVYLLVLLAQADIAVLRGGEAGLLPIASACSVLALVLRVASDLFPSRSTETLVLFALVSAALTLAWLLRRHSPNISMHRIAAAIALFGSYLVVARVLDVQAQTAPLLGIWLYAAAHAAGLILLGELLVSGGWVLAAQGYLFLTLISLTFRFEPHRLPEYLPFVSVPVVVFWLLPFVSPALRGDRLAWLSAGIAPIVHFAVLYSLAKPTWGAGRLGGLSLVLGALGLVALGRAMTLERREGGRPGFATAVFGAVTLLFITAAVPIILDREWITVAWALETAGLAWLATRIREDGLVKASGALAIAVFARLVLNPALWSYHPRSETPILNWYLYTFGIPAIAFLVAAHWLSRNEVAIQLRLPEILRLFSGVVLFVLLNVEIADFYSTGPTLRFRLSGGGLAQDMTYSLAWGLFGLALLGLGIARSSKAARAAALVVVLLTIAKVFLHDLWDLGALYRVGSIVGLAIALLAVSFLTQRYVFARERP